MSHPVKVAFVGAGNMTKEHLKVFADIPEVILSGIFSRSQSKIDALRDVYPSLQPYESIEALFHGTQANLVVVAVPELVMKATCEQVFEYPWTCLLEKPVGYNLAEAEYIASLAKEKNITAYVGLNRRHYSSTIQVLAQLDDTSPRFIQVTDQESPKAMLAFGKDPLLVKHWMFANSIHLVDYFNVLGRGPISSIDPIVAWNEEEPFVVSAKIMYASGDIGIYTALWNAPGPWAVSVTTAQHYFEMRPVESAFVQHAGSRTREAVEVSEWDKQFKPGLRLQAQYVINAIHGKLYNLPTIEDALESMRLVNTIYA